MVRENKVLLLAITFAVISILIVSTCAYAAQTAVHQENIFEKIWGSITGFFISITGSSVLEGCNPEAGDCTDACSDLFTFTTYPFPTISWKYDSNMGCYNDDGGWAYLIVGTDAFCDSIQAGGVADGSCAIIGSGNNCPSYERNGNVVVTANDCCEPYGMGCYPENDWIPVDNFDFSNAFFAEGGSGGPVCGTGQEIMLCADAIDQAQCESSFVMGGELGGLFIPCVYDSMTGCLPDTLACDEQDCAFGEPCSYAGEASGQITCGVGELVSLCSDLDGSWNELACKNSYIMGGELGGLPTPCVYDSSIYTCSPSSQECELLGCAIGEICSYFEGSAGSDCGNGYVDSGEECDDWNTNDGDGCSSICTMEDYDCLCDGIGACSTTLIGICQNPTYYPDRSACEASTEGCEWDGAEYCGDYICQTDAENINTCSIDCDLGSCCRCGGDSGSSLCYTTFIGICQDTNIYPDRAACEASNEGCYWENTAYDPKCAPTCGDGVVDPGEECDDGNINSGDGCNANCITEFCGDTITQAGLGEECDDGNNVNWDGCDLNCKRECGNGVIDGAEECDDGNIISGDGCSMFCNRECGNGVIDGAEECDDGNLINGDGCSSTCTKESICGDGVPDIDGPDNIPGNFDDEECDDGAGNGYTCEPAYGDDCTYCSTQCTLIILQGDYCGDGILNGLEGCDDGNLINGDGCSSMCTIEAGPSCNPASPDSMSIVNGYYQITDCCQLQATQNSLGSSYQLANDIDCSDTINWNSGKGFDPIGPGYSGGGYISFTGTFDGQGHVINNLYVNRPTENYDGLFGVISGATIKNVGLTNVNIKGNSNTGGLVGGCHVTASLIDGVYTTGSVSGTGSDANYAGGIAGDCEAGTIIRNSYSTAEVYQVNQVVGCAGGLAGIMYGYIENCYATGNVVGDGRVGGLVGHMAYSAGITNSFATGEVSFCSGCTASYIGGLLGMNYNSAAILTNNYWYNAQTIGCGSGSCGDTTKASSEEYFYSMSNPPTSSWDTSVWQESSYGFPTLIMASVSAVCGNSIIEGTEECDDGNLDDGDCCSSVCTIDSDGTSCGGSGGAGIIIEPPMAGSISISTCAELQSINCTGNSYLANDIDASCLTANLCNTGYTGTLDGQGHTISNVQHSVNSRNGLFGFMKEGTIKHLNLENVNISGSSSVGGLVGLSWGGTIYNCHVSGIVSSITPTNNIGGIVGSAGVAATPLIISYSSFNGEVSGLANLGGILGVDSSNNPGVIERCTSEVIITGSSNMGGIVGTNYGQVIECSAIGTITGAASGNGGLVGTNDGEILRSFADVDVSGTSSIGGLVGNHRAGATMSDCYANGDATTTSSNNVGGLVGSSASGSSITNTYATGTVTTKLSNAGGLIGYNLGALSNSYATGSVIQVSGSTAYSLGLLIGATTTSFTNSYALNQLGLPCVKVGNSSGCTLVTLESYFYDNANAPESSWDFTNVWKTTSSHPVLAWQAAGGPAGVCQAGVCVYEVCGNGILEGTEECDDGNLINGDGCSSTCILEVIPAICGNNIVEIGEECDDGAVLNLTTCGVGACEVTITDNCVNCMNVACTPGEPSAEICNGIDDDCNGLIDDGIAPIPTTCGLGICAETGELTCQAGILVDSCTEGTPQTEVCDAGYLDEDCDGTENEECNCVEEDTQNCGIDIGECQHGIQTCDIYGQWGTCEGAVYPADEICDELDNNCDGSVDEIFLDLGSFCTAGLGVCGSNGIRVCNSAGDDTECNAIAGLPTGSDDDCNGIDENCNGVADDNYSPTTTTCGLGICEGSGQLICVGGTTQNTCIEGIPQQEVCDVARLDENCDGTSNEGCACDEGQTQSCGESNVGECELGAQTCDINGIWGDCIGAILPADEICDELDNDCDGSVDEIFTNKGDSCTVGMGVCENTGSYVCTIDGTDTECNAIAGSPTGSDDDCNGIDENCNGVADDNYSPTPTTCGVDLCSNIGTLACIDSIEVDTCTELSPTAVYQDADMDAYGNPFITLGVCTLPSGYVFDNTDCNDADISTNPGADDVCTINNDVINRDCNSSNDDELNCGSYCGDTDGDGYVPTEIYDSYDILQTVVCFLKQPGDCNNADANVNPDAVEICDGFDNNCDGEIDEGCSAVGKEATLTLLASLTSTDQKEIDKAIEEIKKSLGNQNPEGDKKIVWLDNTHLACKHGNKVFDKEKKAVDNLGKVDDSAVLTQVQSAIDSLVAVDRLIAETAINEAPAGKDKDKAIEKFNKGEAETNPKKKIDEYKKAWKYLNKHCEKEEKPAKKSSCIEEITVISPGGDFVTAIGEEVGHPNTVFTDINDNQVAIHTSCSKCIKVGDVIEGWTIIEIDEDESRTLTAKCNPKPEPQPKK